MHGDDFTQTAALFSKKQLVCIECSIALLWHVQPLGDEKKMQNQGI